MLTLYDSLKIRFASCPPECSACAEACAAERGGGKNSRIQPLHVPEIGFDTAMTCIQCAVPQCAEVCPTAAITKDLDTGAVRVDEERCVGCSLCTLACPYGGIYYDAQEKKSYSCDKCDGDPACVKACQHEVLSHIDMRSVESKYREPASFVTPGARGCLGCGIDQAFRNVSRVLGKDTIVVTGPGCGILCVHDLPANPAFQMMMTDVPAVMTGVKRWFDRKGQDVKVVAWVGDGLTVDVGFQPLSGAAERGENLIYFCVDNEAYMNTGIQRSGSTPLHGWTYTSPVGKYQLGKRAPAKYLPLIMAFHGIPYTATATVAYLDDLLSKVEKAMQVKNGMAYIHLLSPCPTGWRHASDSSVEISRMAVQTNYFPLWECENGQFRITQKVEAPKPVSDFTKMSRRFAHVKGEALEELQASVDARYKLIEGLCKL